MKYILPILISTLLLLTSHSSIANEDKHHLIGVFLGATNADSETEFTAGIEYEFKFTSQWGAGATYEKTNDAHHGDGVTVTLASLYFHPTNHIRLGLGAGKEKIGGHHPHSEDLIRASASYGLHLKNIGIEPMVAVDFVDDEEIYVYGVALVMGF